MPERIASLWRCIEPIQFRIAATAFYVLAAIVLVELVYLHLWGMPKVALACRAAILLCCLLLLGLLSVRWWCSSGSPGAVIAVWWKSLGTPGLLMAAAVLCYMAIGTAALFVAGEGWRPDTGNYLRYLAFFGAVFLAAALGGRALLERNGVDRLLTGVLAVLTASCIVILASVMLRDWDVLPSYRLRYRMTGAFQDPNEAGFVACMTVVLAAVLLSHGRRRALFYVGLALGCAAALGTASQSSVFATVVTLIFFALFGGCGKRGRMLHGSLALGLLGIFAFLIISGAWSTMRTTMSSQLCERDLTSLGLVHDCSLLLAEKDTLAGDANLNWSRALPIAAWQGVVLGGTPARVVELNLPSMGLTGVIPPILWEMDRLVVLHLGDNQLTGRIPPQLGQLVDLEELLLGGNALSGPIPPQLGDLKQLRRLHLHQNLLSGPIPTELGRLENLRWLNLQNNRLSGRIPSILRELEHLESIQLSHNDFVYTTPEGFENNDAKPKHNFPAASPVRTSPESNSRLLVADRAILLAARDVLAGAAPLNWSDSTPLEDWDGVTVNRLQNRVTALKLPRMGLNGRIPPELGRLDRLVSLDLADNRLTGPIPSSLAGLANLRELRLSGNDFDGCAPPTIRHLLDRDISNNLFCAAFTRGRLVTWQLGFAMVLESPFIGHGLKALESLDGAPLNYRNIPSGVHNLYIRLLGEAGIIPLALYLLFILSLLRLHWTAPLSLARNCVVGWTIILALYSMAYQHLLTVGAFMFLAGLSVALATVVGKDRHTPLREEPGR